MMKKLRTEVVVVSICNSLGEEGEVVG